MSATAKPRVQSQTQSARQTRFTHVVLFVVLLAFLAVIPRDSTEIYPIGAFGDGAGD
jgi:hypothetical protein